MRSIGGTQGIGAPLSPNRTGGDTWIRRIGDRLILDMHEGAGTVVRDLSGNGNDGELRGDINLPVWERNVLSLDGIDDYINVLDSDSLTPSNFLAFCFYFRSSRVAPSIPISKENEYAVELLPNFPYMWLNDAVPVSYISADDFTPPTYWDNLWHDWVCLWLGGKESNSLKMYYDGSERTNLDFGSFGDFDSVKNTANDLNIGYYRLAYPAWWRTRVSFVRINMEGMSKPQILWDYLWNKWRN